MRDTLVAVVVAILCVLALGIGATGVDSLTGDQGQGSPGVETGQGGSQQEASGQQAPESQEPPQDYRLGEENPRQCVAGLSTIEVSYLSMAASLAIPIIVILVTRKKLLGAASFPIAWLVSFIVLLSVMAVFDCAVPGQEVITSVENLTQSNATQEVAGENSGEGSTAWWSRIKILGIIGGGFFVAFLLALYSERRGSDDVAEDPSIKPGKANELGEVAGDVADDIEGNSEPSNAVYRAWAEMADVLDIDDPETSTPTEFADAARDVGLAPDDIAELTALFEEVRYGTATATEDRESRALDALRRIEQTYTQSDGSREEQSERTGGDGQ